MALIGFALERFLIRRTYERELPEQLLLTFALVLIVGDLIKLDLGRGEPAHQPRRASRWKCSTR